MAAAAIGLMLFARGCSERKDSASATKAETADRAATSDGSQPTEFSLSANDDEGYDLPEREEFRQKRKLAQDRNVFIVGVDHFGVDTDHTRVSVIGFDGRVKVETADTDAAEILIVRSARKREDLERQKVEIRSNYNDENLLIHVGSSRPPDSGHSVKRRALKEWGIHSGGDGSLDALPEIRRRVILKLPRNAGLEIRETAGDVEIGGVGGHLRISDVTGNIRVTSAAGPIVSHSINGGIDITFAPLKTYSVRIGGDINGDVDLRFEGEVNADLTAWDNVGAIKPDFPNVEIRASELGELARPEYKARIGNGGSLVELHNINGNVTLSKAGNREASVSKAAAKSD